jgi:putative two-component system response regulator
MSDEKKFSILAVDDSKSNIDLLLDMLGEEYEISVALDGEAALEIAMEEQPDLVITDVVMPGMDGFEVLRSLRENPKTADIPVIFMSGNHEEQEVKKGMEAGAADYLNKPLERENVRESVQKVLG